MTELKGSNPIRYCFVDALIRNIFLSCQQSWTQEIHSHTFFFSEVRPLFFEKRTLHGPSHSLFGSYRILSRVVSIALNPNYKSFPFQRFFSLLPFASFPFSLLLSLFLSDFFVFSCDGHPMYTRFTHMGPSFARYTPSTESRPAAWSWHSSFYGHAHSHLRFYHRSG